ncbi:S-layer homology domain-containing protein [Bacillus benzoevorans]|uniref:SLH domain-containing protein n=1 Tax=Bacillus benzoevorans TaxID=1456 RepID=A0A7X0HQW3_9BACI|nr:S-layer homology domain-containing protein [Bacillus benzoevorans]MBB6445149.1 hypothetical protein [Bacillus benzoevorans]
MRFLRKCICFVFVMALFIAGASLKTEAAVVFSDVPSGHWAEKEIYYLADLGVLKGKANGIFDKDAPVTREEAAAILVRAKGISTANVPNPGFSDVPKTHLFYKEIAAAVNAGWFAKSGKFNPKGQLKRVEMAKITNLAFGISGHVPVDWADMGADYWGYQYITPLLASGITSGYTATTFNPSAPVTRAQMAVFTARSMNPQFRLKIVSYPRKAADLVYYPQFIDMTGANDFTNLNQAMQQDGQLQAQNRKDVMELALEDVLMGQYYLYEVTYSLPRVDFDYISVVFDNYTYTGGAHPNQMRYSFNYDVKNAVFISLHELATKPGYESTIINKLNEMNHEHYEYAGGPASLDEIQFNFYLTRSNFVVYLNPYEFGAYAAGLREYAMPFSLIR